MSEESLIIRQDVPALLATNVWVGSSIVPQKTLDDLGVKTVVSLRSGTIYEASMTLLAPIKDLGVPESHSWMLAVVDFIAATRIHGGVFVHCLAGQGRTGMVGACFLMEHEGYYAKEALAKMVELRGPNCPETVEQRQFVYDFEAWS